MAAGPAVRSAPVQVARSRFARSHISVMGSDDEPISPRALLLVGLSAPVLEAASTQPALVTADIDRPHSERYGH